MTDQSVIYESEVGRMEKGKREQILTAAISTLDRLGLENTTIQNIADEAGIAKGTVYLYFSSKENLIQQVLMYCNGLDIEACEKDLDLEKTVLGKLNRRMRNAIFWSMEHPLESKIEWLIMSSPVYGKGFRYVQQTEQARYVDKILTEGVENGELKPLPVPLLGEILFGMGYAFLSFFKANPELLHDEEIWKNYYQTITDCLASHRD